jgi:hypothetical protein
MDDRLKKKKKFQRSKDKYMFVMSLLLSVKNSGDIQKMKLRMDFLSSVAREHQIFKNCSLSTDTVLIPSHSSYLVTPSPLRVSLDSTQSWGSKHLNSCIENVLYVSHGFIAI